MKLEEIKSFNGRYARVHVYDSGCEAWYEGIVSFTNERLETSFRRELLVKVGDDNLLVQCIDRIVPKDHSTSQGIKVWLDDERDPRDRFIQREFGAHGNEVWVKSAEELIRILETTQVKYISFDHDLGKYVQTGYDVAKWIEEKAFKKELKPIEWRVHSQNPVGVSKICIAMMNADKYWKE